MYIYQIPSLDKTSSDYIIGVIDCSGSMESNWAWLADHWNRFIPLENSSIITFDTTAKKPSSNRLDKDIYKHGGGGTNITAGFVKLDEELKKLPSKANVTVIFISDGEDNNLNTLPARMSELEGNDGTRRLNFICIGVGPGFPTFISMKLREKYHNGDETLPAIFLIEYVSEKAYTIKFEAIRPFLNVGTLRSLKPPVCVFPWREYTDKVFERTWIMTDAEAIEVDGEKVDLRPFHLDLRGINELFRSWNQMINLESLNAGEKVDLRAKKTLALMDAILEELKESKGIDVRAQPKDIKFGSVYERFQFIVNKRNFERTVWYYSDVKKIAAGDTAGGQSDFEAAKRIGLGTIVGKYAQKAFALKNITPAEFEEIKNEFKTLLTTHKVAPKEGGHPLRALLSEDTLGKALDLVKNQLELFETFPLHGHPAKIIRNDQGQIDAQKVDLRYLGTHQTLELLEITGEQGGTLNVATEDGKSETANAVVPLFSKDDQDLLPFINSRLYKLLLSWDLIRDPDTLLDQTFACLLTGTFAYALRADPPNKALLEKVSENLELIRANAPVGDLFTNPPSDLTSLTTELDTEKKPKKVQLAKVLLNAFGFLRLGWVSPEQLKELLTWAEAVALHSVLHKNVDKLKTLFNLNIVKKSAEESPEVAIANKIRAVFSKVRSMGDLARKLFAEITEATLHADVEIVFLPHKLEKLLENSEEWQLIRGFRALAGVPDISPADREALVCGAFGGKEDHLHLSGEAGAAESKATATAALKAEIKKGSEKKDAEAKKGKKGKKGKKEEKTAGATAKKEEMKRNPLFRALLPGLEKEFQAAFKQVHKEVVPLPREELEAICRTNGLSAKNLQLNASTGLPIRTCGAQGCHFFMKPMPRLDSHLKVWGCKLPKGFHLLVRENRTKSAKEIYGLFAQTHFTEVEGKAVPFDPTKFDKTEEEVLEYIEKLRAAYAKIA